MPVIRSFNSNSVVIQTIYSKFVLIRTLYSKFYVIQILCIRIYIVIRTHLYASSTSSTYIALQPLGVFDLSSTSSTCFDIHRIWWYGWKALSLSFQNFFRIENPLSIKEVMSQNVWYVLFPSSTSSTYIALQPLCVFDLSSTSSTCFDIHRIWWYGWKALSLSFPKLFLDWKSIKY